METLSEQAARIRAGDLDPVQMVEQCLARIEEREADVRAWVIVDREGALRHASQIAADVAAGTAAESPLLGAVVGVKDIFDVQGFPTRAGAGWTDDAPAQRDACVVAGLRAAGAVILGKTVTTELACFDPSPTRNPLNLQRTPGGSSSGSAAAVADGMCHLAIGSQTGGSITRPASFCGVLGLKPTFGALSMTGVMPFSIHLDHPGPIARCTDDLFDALAAMRGDSSRARPHAPHAEPGPNLRIGRLDEPFRTRSSDDVWRLFHQAMAQLAELEPAIEPAMLPSTFADVAEMHRRLMFADAAAEHAAAWREFGDTFGPCIAQVMREGVDVSRADYIDAAKHQLEFRRDLLEGCFQEFDLLASPATVTTAQGPETTGDPSFNAPWSYCGFPTLCTPCGVDGDGLPASIQWIARPGEEALLRWIGREAEQLASGVNPRRA